MRKLQASLNMGKYLEGSMLDFLNEQTVLHDQYSTDGYQIYFIGHILCLPAKRKKSDQYKSIEHWRPDHVDVFNPSKGNLVVLKVTAYEHDDIAGDCTFLLYEHGSVIYDTTGDFFDSWDQYILENFARTLVESEIFKINIDCVKFYTRFFDSMLSSIDLNNLKEKTDDDALEHLTQLFYLYFSRKCNQKEDITQYLFYYNGILKDWNDLDVGAALFTEDGDTFFCNPKNDVIQKQAQEKALSVYQQLKTVN